MHWIFFFFSGPPGETPRLSTSKKAIDCNIENFVTMVAVTKQNAVPSIEFSTTEESFERDAPSSTLNVGKEDKNNTSQVQ